MTQKTQTSAAGVAVIGAANIDITAHTERERVPQDSNPGRVTLTYGGVGRNIAHNLCLLGLNVSFLTVFGDDDFAASVMRSCEALKMDISKALVIKGEKSSVYVCVTGPDGDLDFGVSDMEIVRRITTGYVMSNERFLNGCRAVVFDTNLTEETMEYILQNIKVPLFADTVSCTKAAKLANLLSRGGFTLHTLKTNRYEAKVMTGIDVTDADTARGAVEKLKQMGVENVFLTLGADGVLCGNRERTLYLPCGKVKAVNASGAGDAFLAALVYGGISGASLEESARMGMAASELTLGSESAVSDMMSPAALSGKEKK